MRFWSRAADLFARLVCGIFGHRVPPGTTWCVYCGKDPA